MHDVLQPHAPLMSGSITLGDVAERTEILAVPATGASGQGGIIWKR
jgi:hypothetical protein